MKNILLLTVILAVGVIAFIYYRKKTSNGSTPYVNPLTAGAGGEGGIGTYGYAPKAALTEIL